jgi:hypothetical protein
MGPLLIFVASLIGSICGFVWLSSAAPAFYHGIAAATLTTSLIELILLPLLMGRLVNGPGRHIKPDWLANLLAEIAFMLVCLGLLFLVGLVVDFKHLHFGTFTEVIVTVLATVAGSILLTTLFTGEFKAANHRRPATKQTLR